MSKAAYLNAPFVQPPVQVTPAAKITTVPVAPGQSELILFVESRLRRNHSDGADLVDALRQVFKRAPAIGQVIADSINGGGRETERQGCIALRTFLATRVAVLPERV